jgi:hypothetical protein
MEAYDALTIGRVDIYPLWPAPGLRACRRSASSPGGGATDVAIRFGERRGSSAALTLPGAGGFVIGRASLCPADGDVAAAVDAAAVDAAAVDAAAALVHMTPTATP